jgi:hypothetical protein
LKEQLADEIAADLRAVRARALADAQRTGTSVSARLTSKGISYGTIRANVNGSVDTSGVEGVDPDLRVRPFFAHGGTISIREFVVAALHNEMGLEAVDPLTLAASPGACVVTPGGMVLDGTLIKIEALLPWLALLSGTDLGHGSIKLGVLFVDERSGAEQRRRALVV